MTEDNKPVCIINKTKKKIGPNGESFDYKNLVVQGLTMDETKKAFDERWDKDD